MIAKEHGSYLGIGTGLADLPFIEELLFRLPRQFSVVIAFAAQEEPSVIPLFEGFSTRVVHRDEELQPGFLYIAPGGKGLVVKNSTLTLKDRGEADGNPIDDLFGSMAREWGPSAKALLLEKTAQDGQEGIHQILQRGGSVFNCSQAILGGLTMEKSRLVRNMEILVTPPASTEAVPPPLSRIKISELEGELRKTRHYLKTVLKDVEGQERNLEQVHRPDPVFETLEDTIFLLDLGGQVLGTWGRRNPFGEGMALDQLPPEALKQLHGAQGTLKASLAPRTWEFLVPGPHSSNWFSARISPLLDAQRKIQSMVLVVRDTTLLKRTEAHLRENESLFRTVFEASPLGIFLATANSIRACNQAFADIFQAKTPGQTLGLGFEWAIAADHHGEFLRIIDQFKADPAANTIADLTGTRLNGEQFPFRLHLTHIKLGGDKAALGIVEDLSQIRKLENSIQNIQRLESLGLVAGGLAHDFNNLLGGIFGNIQLAQKLLPQDSKAQAYLTRALGIFQRTQDLTRQLLSLSKGGEPVKQRVNLGPLMKKHVPFLLSGTSISLIFQVEEELWPVWIDPQQFFQVIDNLVINARQAMGQGGELLVRARNLDQTEDLPGGMSPGKRVLIEVEDSGPGIPPDVLPKIFDPYFTTKHTGTGLGLATVQTIARRHKGIIEALSPLGRGAVFRVQLPAEVLEPASGVSSREIQGKDGVPVVVLLDDDDDLREVAREMMEGMGYAVQGFKTGREALEFIEASVKGGVKVDLALLDLTLPGEKGGGTVQNEVKRIDPGIKTAAFSGYPGNPIMSHPELYGFEACLTKPFTEEQLRLFLARVIGPQKLKTAKPWRSGSRRRPK